MWGWGSLHKVTARLKKNSFEGGCAVTYCVQVKAISGLSPAMAGVAETNIRGAFA